MLRSTVIYNYYYCDSSVIVPVSFLLFILHCFVTDMKKIFVLILIFWIGFGHGQRTFDVLKYGAAGDGKTDDSKVIYFF